MSKMARWKTIRNLSDLGIIVSVPTLFVILLLLVLGLTNLGDKITVTILCIMGLVLLISLGMDRIYQSHSEEIRVAEQNEEKQLLFTPSIGITVMFLFFIAMPVISIISQFPNNKDDSGLTIASIGFGALFIWMWYIQPVFIFTEDSVKIKSHPFYLLGIDWKTVIKYADITSVRPNTNYVGGWGGEGPGHTLMIFMNGTMKSCFLMCYNGDTIARIWLRFKENLGDRVILP